MVILDILAGALLFVPLCIAAVTDYRHMIVPNWICGLIALGFVLFAAAHWSEIDLQMHLLIAGILFGIALICWFAGWLGGGDVKLLGAVGLWLGTPYAFAFLFILAVTSAVLSSFLLLVGKLSNRSVDSVPAALKPAMRMAKEGRFAYAIPIVLAALATLPQHFL
ncbi:MAG: A24 family peptidase [Aestuariivirgaceae bacterium]